MNLPNKLSIVRIILVPFIVVFMLFPFNVFNISFPVFTFFGVSLSLINIICLIIFLIASITDFLDGYLARKDKIITSFGQFIDPIADKVLINTCFIIFAYKHMVPCLPVVIMVLRDIIVDGCRMFASQKGVVIAASFYGKLKTVSQIVTIILIFINNFPFEIWHLPISDICIWFTSIISIYSGIHYFNAMNDYIFESI